MKIKIKNQTLKKSKCLYIIYCLFLFIFLLYPFLTVFVSNIYIIIIIHLNIINLYINI